MKTMAVDLGDVRTGVAFSDPTGTITGSMRTLRVPDREKLSQKLAELAYSEGAGEIVLGLPLNMDGTEGERALKSRAFGDLLAEKSGLPVYFVDERLTTVTAAGILHQNGRRASRDRIDAVAASVILESWLAKKEKSR